LKAGFEIQYFFNTAWEPCFFTSIQSEESIAKSSRMIYSCDKIRIATKNKTKQTRHHCNIKCSLLTIQLWTSKFKRSRSLLTVLSALVWLWR